MAAAASEDPALPAPASGRSGPRRRTVVALSAGFVAAWVVVGFYPIQPTDLDIFFWPSVRAAVGGHPLLVYAVAGGAAYPNANGPLALGPLTAAGLILQRFGLLDSGTPRRALALGVFSVFVLLMAREGVAAIDRLRGRRVEGWPRLTAYAALAAGIPIWDSVAGYGHVEQPLEMWLMLLAVRWLGRGRFAAAGLALGLAALARSTVLMLCVPMAFAAWRRGTARAVTMLGVTGVVGLAGISPFVLADRPDVVHSLITYRGGLAVGAGSIWTLARGTSLEPIGQHADVYFVLALVFGLNLWLASRPDGLTEARLFAALALTAASFTLLAKTVWPYYFLEVYVFVTVWAAGRWRRGDPLWSLLLAPVAISVLGLVGEVGSSPIQRPEVVRLEGAAMFVALALFIAVVARAAARSPAPGRPRGGPVDQPPVESISSPTGPIDRSSPG